MNKFTETFHCKSGAHCGRCRDKAGGRKFRTAMSPDDVDFSCPRNLPWLDKESEPKVVSAITEKKPQRLIPLDRTPVAEIEDKVKQLQPDSEKNMWIISMVTQCVDTRDNTKGLSPCAKSRQNDKIRNYWKKYIVGEV